MRKGRFATNYRNLEQRYGEYLIKYLSKHFGDQIQPLDPLVHDALSIVAEILTDEPDRISQIKSYLTSVARNAALAQISKNPEPDPPEPIKIDGEDEYRAHVKEWLGLPENAHAGDFCDALAHKLSEPCRTILKLYAEGKSPQFIADVVGMKYDSVKSKKSQCINSLKTLISKL